MPDSSPDRWQQVERLYDQALERDPAARDAFLDETCRGDEALRREVASLLDFERAADQFLERPALAEAARGLSHESRRALTGRRLGGYEVAALVGVGGMGEVYRARDIRLGRDVALKVLEPSVAADPVYLRRFEEEARSASVLNHPNIVTIYGVGEEGDIAFIAMELVEGRTLREHLSAGPLPVAAALDLAVQLAGALTAAHARDIAHRDLKPENVMVTPGGLVKVLDFGIARRQWRVAAPPTPGDPAETRATVTQVGTILGTVGYMSPEQATGKPAGFASDQFSFGAIFYEMLSGRRAFQRDSRIETLAAIIDGQPPPVESLNPRVPASVRRVIARCLAKAPDARYPDSRDLEADLRRVKDTLTPRPSRRQLLWSGAATAAAVAVGGAAWRFWPLPALAVLPFSNTGGNPDADYLCIGITGNLIGRLKDLPITVKHFSLVSNFTKTALDPREVGRQLGVDMVLAGGVRLEAGHLLISATLIDVASGRSLWTDTYDRASADIFAMWDAIALAVVDDGLHLRLSRDEKNSLLSRPTNSTEAYNLFLRARPFQMEGSAESYTTARQLLAAAVARDASFAEAWVALAGTYWTSALDNFMVPRDAWLNVGRCLEQATASKPLLPDLHFGNAITKFYSRWDWSGAEREWQIAVRPPDKDLQPELLLPYALGRWALGDTRGALRIVRRARGMDPISPLFILHEAGYLREAGRLDEAASAYESVIRTHQDNPAPYFGLADVRYAQGRYDEAVATRRNGHALRPDNADEELQSVLATASGKEGYDLIDAAALRRLELRKLERREAGLEYASPLDFARAYAQLGDKDQAFDYLDAAFEDGSPALVFLNVDRAWTNIRAESKFQAAVARLRFPTAGAHG